MATTSRLKRAIQAGKAAMQGQRYQINGKPLLCPLCGNNQFKAGLWIPRLGMRPLTCSSCTHAQFFEKLPATIDD
ncbi:MAG: hypothetical protein ACTHMT_14215 [Verrucomicrobiota bacterium]|jgi:hypothetical protein